MTIKESIIKTLEGRGFVWSGELSREIHELSGHKEAIIERRARELAKAGFLLTHYEQVNREGPKCVMYRLAPPKTAIREALREPIPTLFKINSMYQH